MLLNFSKASLIKCLLIVLIKFSKVIDMLFTVTTHFPFLSMFMRNI